MNCKLRTTEMRDVRSADARCEFKTLPLAPRIYASEISHLCSSRLTFLLPINTTAGTTLADLSARFDRHERLARRPRPLRSKPPAGSLPLQFQSQSQLQE